MKPTPKKEIHCAWITKAGVMHIECVTQDASRWVLDNVAEYGMLSPLSSGKQFHLYFNPEIWDGGELVTWIESCGSSDTTGA